MEIKRYRDWKNDPVTEDILDRMRTARELCVEAILQTEHTPENLSAKNRLLGKIDILDMMLSDEGLKEFLEVEEKGEEKDA